MLKMLSKKFENVENVTSGEPPHPGGDISLPLPPGGPPMGMPKKLQKVENVENVSEKARKY